MNDTLERWLWIVALVTGATWWSVRGPSLAPANPGPMPVVKPAPDRKPLLPWRDKGIEAAGTPVVGGKTSPDGTVEIACDLPRSEKFANKGGRDGAGLCVFASITWASRWQNDPLLWGLFDSMRKEPGGGYPSKVDAMIAKYASGAQYVQYEGVDAAILRDAIRTGRMPSVTYDGHDPHYGMGRSIAHMVNLVHLDDQWAAISDNNYPGDDQIVWMSPGEFKRRWTGGRSGWAVILLNPPPPPPPKGSPMERQALAGLTALAFALGPSVANAQTCSGGSCSVSAPMTIAQADAPLTWQAIDGEEFALMRGTKQVGSYNHVRDEYRPRHGQGDWGPVGKPPIDPPPHPLIANVVGGVEPNYGVEWSKVARDGEHYAFNGRPVTKAQALSAIGGDKLPDDSGRLRLTVIGPEAERKRVLDDLKTAAALTPLRDKLSVQGYDPSAWAVAQAGFVTNGHPTIYLQSPTGQVLHRQDDYQGGAESLAAAIRKADPAYQPEKDADKRKTPVLPFLGGFDWKTIPPVAWLAIGAGLLIFWRGKS